MTRLPANQRLQRSLRCIFIAGIMAITFPVMAMTSEEPDPELRSALLSAVSEADSFADQFDAQVWLMDMANRMKR